MNLTTPESIRSLQRKLYDKAKKEVSYRFYSLYDKILLTPSYNYPDIASSHPPV